MEQAGTEDGFPVLEDGVTITRFFYEDAGIRMRTDLSSGLEVVEGNYREVISGLEKTAGVLLEMRYHLKPPIGQSKE